MTNPAIDPISYNAGIEAAAKWHDEQERLFRMRALSHLEAPLPAPEAHDAQDQVADLHRDAAKSLRSLHRTESQTAPPDLAHRQND